MILQQEPICALATANGVGAIALIRVSGQGSIESVNKIFKGKDLCKVESHTVHFGMIEDIDEVLVTVFKTPKSFTKEDSVEISCHGSSYIVQEVLKLLIKNGARLARAGEFTQRAFLNGQFDLVQAEAVADLIAADSEANHRTALNQLRGGFSKQLAALRQELIHFASMVELELDFGEEDVEFAQRDDLKQLIQSLQSAISPLIDSFHYGNALKEGIPVAIVGAPNVGKSTLLNALLNEEKAIVTPIAGTTRDTIEDILVIEGVKFRVIDTAGIRETTDLVESMGIERSKQAIEKAEVVLAVYDSEGTFTALKKLVDEVANNKTVIWIRNKCDVENPQSNTDGTLKAPPLTGSGVGVGLYISAKTGEGIAELKQKLINSSIVNRQSNQSSIVTNLRHYEHLQKTNQALTDVLNGLEAGITGDFLAQDIRLALHHLGEITGTVVSDDLLANIFSKFCIGK